MLYSVEQVASKLSVSKQSIYSKLKLKDYKDKTVIKQGKTMIDEELFKLIQDNIKIKGNLNNDINIEPQEATGEAEIATDTTNTEDLVNMNKELISALLEQLKIKDLQIQEKDIQILNLNNRLKQEQELHQNTQVLFKQNQPQDIKQLEQHFSDLDEKLMNIKEQMEQRKEKYDSNFAKKGLLNKLFNK